MEGHGVAGAGWKAARDRGASVQGACARPNLQCVAAKRGAKGEATVCWVQVRLHGSRQGARPCMRCTQVGKACQGLSSGRRGAAAVAVAHPAVFCCLACRS